MRVPTRSVADAVDDVGVSAPTTDHQTTAQDEPSHRAAATFDQPAIVWAKRIAWIPTRERLADTKRARDACFPRPPGIRRLMLSAYLFNRREGKQVEAWPEELRGLGKREVLWIDLEDASPEEVRSVSAVLELSDDELVAAADEVPSLDQHETHLHLTAVGVAGTGQGRTPEPVPIECFIGKNWIVTTHAGKLEVLDDFRGRITGGGGVGILDAPSFLALLLGWVVQAYLQALDTIEVELEEFDVRVLRSPHGDAEELIGVLVEIRQRVGGLRRSLALHRDVFAALTVAEFDPLSSEESAAKFADLSAKTEAALAAARDAKDSVTGSFDVLIARSEHRTNEIVKILTVASILLLPGALIAGVMGMNVNFKLSLYAHSTVFLVSTAAIVLVAAATLAIARLRHWV